MSACNRRLFAQRAGAMSMAFLAAGCSLPSLSRPPAPKVHHIAYFSGALPNPAGEVQKAAFTKGLNDLGYVEGQNLVIEERYSSSTDFSETAAELVRLQPDVILVSGVFVASAVRASSATIPIVNAGQGDLLAEHLVDSLGRPGGNITGLSNPPPVGKQLQLMQETVPALSRLAILYDRSTPIPWELYESTASTLGLQASTVGVDGSDALEPFFEQAVREHVEAVFIAPGSTITSHQARIAELATQHRLPTLWQQSDAVARGGLMAYGPNRADLYRRAAAYVDKILRGASPADLPIEQPSLFDLVVNLKTARALGLTIPQTVLAQATEIIQ